MKVLVVEPMKPCEAREIPDTLEAMQAIVGGGIEATYPFAEPVAVICNAEGKGLDLPYNRPLMDESGLPYDIVCGTFFLARVEGEHFASLTEEQLQKYKVLYDNSPLAKLGKAVKIADASNQRKAKSETVSAVAIAFREDTKSFGKSDSVFNKDTLL